MARDQTDHFLHKKENILRQLALPEAEYNDLSPKGSVDEGIRDLVAEINASNGFVTTSSCSGRISVFLEGNKGLSEQAQNNDRESQPRKSLAGPGGKGGGGKWLFTSHEPVDLPDSCSATGGSTLMDRFGLHPSSDDPPRNHPICHRLIHFKFEPMILHILTASSAHAQMVLSAAVQAGFRESGAINLEGSAGGAATPMVAVRSTGLWLDSIIGYAGTQENAERYIPFVTEEYVQLLVTVANERFKINAERTRRFRTLFEEKVALLTAGRSKTRIKTGYQLWEDSASRRERKKAEGLRHDAEIRDRPHKLLVSSTPELVDFGGVLD